MLKFRPQRLDERVVAITIKINTNLNPVNTNNRWTGRLQPESFFQVVDIRASNLESAKTKNLLVERNIRPDALDDSL